MVGRIAETDLSVPVRRGPWWYYQRTEEGQSYPVHARRPAGSGRGRRPRGLRSRPTNRYSSTRTELATGHDYLHVANLVVSPDHRWLAYGVDTTGSERYELRFRQCRATDRTRRRTEIGARHVLRARLGQ